MRRQERGYSLVETMVAFLIAMLILGSLYMIFMQSTRDFEGSGEEAQLVASARAVIEHMERDVAAGHQVLIPEQGASSKITLAIARYLPDDPAKRVDANASGDKIYPFWDVDQQAPPRLPALRVTYRFNGGTGEVTRLEESGFVEAQTTSDAGHPNLMSHYVFKPPALLVSSRTLAPTISGLALSYLYFDETTRQPMLVTNDADLPRTVCIGVDLDAVKNTGVYAPRPGQAPAHRQPGIHIVTKLWLMRRVSEIVNPEYFSSVDEDLRF